MLDVWRLPTVKLCLALIMIVAAIDLIAAQFVPYRIGMENFRDTGTIIPEFAVVMALFAWIVRHFETDQTRPAQIIRFAALKAYECCALTGLVAVFTDLAALLSVLAASAGLPMQDAFFSSADQALGFQWESYVAWLNSSPVIVWVLIKAYLSLAYTIPFCMAYLVLRGRTQQVYEFAALMALSSFFTIVISCFVPAIGGYTYYGPDPRSTSEFIRQFPNAGTSYVAGLLKVHAGLLQSLDLNEIKNLIQFPSFHGILGLLLIYQTRKDRYLFWPYLLINSVMMLSIVPVGGHHAVDFLGAVGVFLASLAIVGYVEGKPSLYARFQSWRARLQAGWPGRLARPVAAYARRAINSSGTRRPAVAVRRV